MKPGYQTSEWWLTVVVNLVMFLVLFGFVSAVDKDNVISMLSDLVKSAFALIVSATSVWKYIHARMEAKKAETELQKETLLSKS